MKKILGIFGVVAGLLSPFVCLAQNERSDDGQRNERGYESSRDQWAGHLSAEDQGRFDSYYSRWLGYRQTNDQEQIASMERRMRDVMIQHSIPPDVPFSRIATNNAQSYGGYRPSDGRRGDDRQRRDAYGNGQWGGRLSAEDQGRFDSYYSRWQGYRQTNDREQVASMEKRMRDVMVHYGIPSNVPFAQVATGNNQSYGGCRPGNGRRDDDRQGQGNYGNGQWRGRVSADDQNRFRSYYSRWQGYRQTNNQEQIASMEKRMRDVMTKNNIPGDLSFDEVMNMLNGNNRN